MSRVVIFTPCGPLIVDRITRDDSGRIKTAKVINGGWNFEVRGSEQLAKAENSIVNRWPDEPFDEVALPSTFRGDYNAAIAWAEEHRKKVT